MRLTSTEEGAISALEDRLATTAEVWRGRGGTYISVKSSKGLTGCGASVALAIGDLIKKLGLQP